MLRRFLNWLIGPRGNNPVTPRRRSRLTGCLLWVLALIVLLIILLILFGGFQKGTKVGALRQARVVSAAPLRGGASPAGRVHID